ncbi:MAG: hypothetical protein K9K75_00415 [Deltaproteobacteria bacterium]|nr:hypothetical protein [Deltaproteobacteria bacterium]
MVKDSETSLLLVLPVSGGDPWEKESSFIRSAFIAELTLAGYRCLSPSLIDGVIRNATKEAEVNSDDSVAIVKISERGIAVSPSIPLKVIADKLSADAIFHIEIVEATRTTSVFSAYYRLHIRFQKRSARTGEKLWAREYNESDSVWGFNKLRMKTENTIGYSNALSTIIRRAVIDSKKGEMD